MMIAELSRRGVTTSEIARTLEVSESAARYPVPQQLARRRVKTPPGAQAQADWGEFRSVRVGGRRCTLYGSRRSERWRRFPIGSPSPSILR